MDQRSLLLLQNRVRDIPDSHDDLATDRQRVPGIRGLSDRRGGRKHWRSVHVEVAVVFRSQHRAARPPTRCGRVERMELGPQDFRTTKRFKKVAALQRLATAPLAHLPVGPLDRVAVSQEGHPIGHVLQHAYQINWWRN